MGATRNPTKCTSLEYRQGFIEVIGAIHNKCVDLEVWEVSADRRIDNVNLSDDSISDDDITANCELELSLEEAEELIHRLRQGIDEARGNI